MTEHRARMMTALKTHFVAPLRERGFVGAFPHLRRESAERVDYLNVQFYSSGGSFTLNLGRTGPDGFTEGTWQDLPVSEITANHMMVDRRRVTPRDAKGPGKRGEFWEFGPRMYDEPRPPEPQPYYDRIAAEAFEALVRVGEPWFARPDPPERGDEPAAPREGWQMGDPLPVLSRLYWDLRLRRPRMRVGAVVGGAAPPLWRLEQWQKIAAVMDGVVERLPRPVSILSVQIPDAGPDRKLPFGRIAWSEAGHRKWTGKYLDGPEPVHFLRTEFWAPSRSTWADEGKAPEMYARLDHSPYGENQGFILALRRDQLRTPGLAEAADRTLDAVAAALPGSRRVINDRGWADSKLLMMEWNPLDWPSSDELLEHGEKRPWSQVRSFTAR